MASLRHFVESNLLVALRVFALFQVFSLLHGYALQPIMLGFLSLAAILFVHASAGLVRVPTFMQLPGRVQSLAILHGAWFALNFVFLLSGVCKLHPFRFIVGEYFEVTIVFFLSSRREGSLSAFGSSANTKTIAVLLSAAAVALGWASNLGVYSTMRPTANSQQVSSEDLVNAMDSVGGMILLGLYCISEVLRKAVHSRMAIECGEDEMDIDAISLGAGAVVLLPIAVFFSAFGGRSAASTSEVQDWSLLSGVPQLILCSTILLASPKLHVKIRALLRVAARKSDTRSDAAVRVLAAAVVAFICHIFYHRHYRADEPAHPIFHVDNVLVLCSAGLMAAALQKCGSASQKYALVDEVLAHDPALFFSPTPTQDPSLTSLFAAMFDSPKERKLLSFLGMTLFFMFVELLYGMHVNSLGLVSDAFHMLLDSASIAIGLYAAHMATWRANDTHTFGYGRYEMLSGFTNGVLLLFVAGYILGESISRVLEPPTIDSQYLLPVSITGLFINIVGVFIFCEDGGHGHSHGGGHSHGAHDHAHSSDHHDDEGGGGKCDQHRDQNLRGVYLHILADLFGSIGVITSSFIVKYTGFMAADPICSFLIALLIALSAAPLLSDTGSSLMLRSPEGLALTSLEAQILKLDGVLRVDRLHAWVLSAGTVSQNVCTVHITVTDETSEEIARSKVAALLRSRQLGAGDQGELVCIEVEKALH